MPSKFRFYLSGILVVLSLSACGGGGGEGDEANDQDVAVDSPPPVQVGVILDSPIVGIGFRTGPAGGPPNAEGLTGPGGTFPLFDGANVTFHIGDIVLPTIATNEVITPLDLFSTADINDTEVVNFARLVQTLDSDGDPQNGITISRQAHEAATGMSLDFSSTTFDTDVTSLLIDSGVAHGTLIGITEAVAHLNNTLQRINSSLFAEFGYFEVWGAESDSNLFSTFPHDLLGTSRSGNIFDVSGYEYFIVYAPWQTFRPHFDQISRIDIDNAPVEEFGLLHTANLRISHPDPNCNWRTQDPINCFVETEQFAGYVYPDYFLHHLDGLTIEALENKAAYYADGVEGAEFIKIVSSVLGQFPVNLNIADYQEPPPAGNISVSGGPPDLDGSSFYVPPRSLIYNFVIDSLSFSFSIFPHGSDSLVIMGQAPPGVISAFYPTGHISPSSVLFNYNGSGQSGPLHYSLSCLNDDCSGITYNNNFDVVTFSNVVMQSASAESITLNGSVNLIQRQ